MTKPQRWLAIFVFSLVALAVDLHRDASALRMHGYVVSPFDEALYVSSGRRLFHFKFPPLAYSPGLVFFYGVIYSFVRHGMLWLFQADAVGRSILYVALFLAVALAASTEGSLLVAGMALFLLTIFDIPGQVIANSSDAMYSVMSGMAFWQTLLFARAAMDRRDGRKHLELASAFIGYGMLIRCDGVLQELIILCVVFLSDRLANQPSDPKQTLNRMWSASWPFACIGAIGLLGEFVPSFVHKMSVAHANRSHYLAVAIAAISAFALAGMLVRRYVIAVMRQHAKWERRAPLLGLALSIAVAVLVLNVPSVRQRSYFAFEQGETWAWNATPLNQGPFVEGLTLAPQRYGSAIQNRTSILRAIRHAPLAYEARLTHTIKTLPAIVELAYGPATPVLIGLVILGWFLLWKERRLAASVAILWPITLAPYFITFFRAGYFYLPVVSLLYSASLSPAILAARWSASRKSKRKETHGTSPALTPALAIIGIAGAAICITDIVQAKPTTASETQLAEIAPLLSTLRQKLPEDSTVSAYDWLVADAAGMRSLSFTEAPIDSSVKTEQWLCNSGIDAVVIDQDFRREMPSLIPMITRAAISAPNPGKQPLFRIVYRSPDGASFIALRNPDSSSENNGQTH